MPATLRRLLASCYCNSLDKKLMCLLVEQRTSTYGCFDSSYSSWWTRTALANKNPQISRQLNAYGIRWSGNLLFFQNLSQPLPNCDSGYEILRPIYRRMIFGTFMTLCMREFTPALPPEGVTLCIDVTLWTPLSVTCVSFDLNVLSYTPTMINYRASQILCAATDGCRSWPWLSCLPTSGASYWRSGRQYWEKLRHLAVIQCATLAHPCSNLSPISSNVSSVRTWRRRLAFLFFTEPVSLNLLACLLIALGLGTGCPGNLTRNLRRVSEHDFLLFI